MMLVQVLVTVIVTVCWNFHYAQATISSNDYSYSYNSDDRRLQQPASSEPWWSTNSIRPLSLLDSTMISSDTSLSYTIMNKKNPAVRKSKLIVHHDCMMDDGDDIDLVHLSNLRRRKQTFDRDVNLDDDDPPSLIINQLPQRQQHHEQVGLAWRHEPPVHVDWDDTILSKQTQQNYKKTGTTIVGVAGTNYCILGADTRATSNTMVADKRCWKLHPLSLNCAAAGAGTSADLDHITRECYYQVQLWFSTSSPHSSSLQSVGNNPLCTNTTLGMLPKVSVRQICRYLQHRLYEQGGACQANLIVGGVEENGQGILRAIHPDGSMDVLTYSALGSGSLAAMGILENVIQDDRHNLSIEDAIQLVVKAVKAGIDHDLGSGSQVDLCIITPDGIANYTRSYLPEETLDDEEAVLLTADIATTTSSETSSNGINGFGNIPYVVRSKRVIQNSSQRCKDEVTRELWKEILPE